MQQGSKAMMRFIDKYHIAPWLFCECFPSKQLSSLQDTARILGKTSRPWDEFSLVLEDHWAAANALPLQLRTKSNTKFCVNSCVNLAIFWRNWCCWTILKTALKYSMHNKYVYSRLNLRQHHNVRMLKTYPGNFSTILHIRISSFKRGQFLIRLIF